MEEPQQKKRLSPGLPGWLKAWPVYLMLAVVVSGTVYMVRHRKAGVADPILPAAIVLEQNIEIQFQDVIMQGRQKGVQRWVISSPKVSLSKDGRYTYFAPDPTGSFLNLKDWQAKTDESAVSGSHRRTGGETDGPEAPSSEKPGKNRSLVWKAKKARFDSFTEDLEIDGKAVITTDGQDVIHTERVEYKSKLKEVHMPKPVDVKMKDGTDIKADSLQANTGAEVFELRGHVRFDATVGNEEKL